MPAADLVDSITNGCGQNGVALLAVLQDFEDRIYALENP
jgi:hypothetical protein